MKKREFIKTIGLAGLAWPFHAEAIPENVHPLPDSTLDDKAFWLEIRNQYKLKPTYINLENGYYNMMPEPVLAAQIEHLRDLNLQASYYMRTEMKTEMESIRKELSDFLGCSDKEIILTRNTTESMDTIISGYPWKKGDEAVMCNQEYGAMLDMFKQQADRFGIVNKIISLPLNPKTDEEIVARYKAAINPKTKMILISHMINLSGQILPIKKICAMAHQVGVEVLVDGAHAIGHLDFNISDLNCDYYGASLHKWLSAPLGSGVLYVKADKVKSIWPLFAESEYTETDIRKLMHHGTQPLHVEKTLPTAIQFYRHIGGKRKEDRLRFLQNYWLEKVRPLKNLIVNTPQDKTRSCAIANVGIKGKNPQDLAQVLLEKYQIWTVGIEHPALQGCRITPNIYTSTEDLDRLIMALQEIAQA